MTQGRPKGASTGRLLLAQLADSVPGREVVDGRVTELRGTADRLAMLTQLGILPDVGWRAGTAQHPASEAVGLPETA